MMNQKVSTVYRAKKGAPFFIILFSAFLLAVSGCGDEQVVSLRGPGNIQGVWEGTLSLTPSSGELTQLSRIRLELVQRDFNFEGYLLKIDPLAEGLGRSPVDTFLVTQGTVSDNFISFRVVDPQGGTTVFQGEVFDSRMAGTTQGTDYTGEWNAVFLF